MMLNFDHVIHYVKNAYEIMDLINKREEISVVNGGRHENRGTYNTLLHFGLSYIEYLSIYDSQNFEEYDATNITYSPFSTIEKDGFREGFYRIAIRTQNLNELLQLFKAKGLKINGPLKLSRKQPNGQIIKWKLLFIGEETSSLPLPFFIEWSQSDEERYNELQTEGFIKKSNEEKHNFSYVGMAVYNLQRNIENWSNWFNLKSGPIEIDQELNAKTQKLYLSGGDLMFAEPLGQGIVDNFLKDRGERVFMLSLQNDMSKINDKKIRNGLYRFS